MRIALTSDLHLDSTDANRALVPLLAERAAALRPDVLVLAGDISARLPHVEETFAAFAHAAPVRLFVPGNHDVWIARSAQAEGATSNHRHDVELRDVCAAHGFTHLGLGPRVVDGVGFAGSIGWYDYSFRHPAFPFSDEELARKAKGKYRWMDLFYVRWVDVHGRELDDAAVTARFAATLREHLAALDADPAVRDIVVVTHHVPYVDVLRTPAEDKHGYFRTYLGATALGEAIDAHGAKLRAVLHGHLHRPVDERRPGGALVRSAPVGYLRPAPADPSQVAAHSVTLVELPVVPAALP